MLDTSTIQFVCDRTEEYWRRILARRSENDYLVEKLSGQNQDRVHAAVCTVNAVHTCFPFQSDFQKSNHRGLILHGENRPLWMRNDVGIWHPIIATVFCKASEYDVLEDVPIKEILRLLMSQMMDSIYVLIVEIDAGVVHVRMVNLFDKLDCVLVRRRNSVSVVLDVRKLSLAEKERSVCPQRQMESLLKIYHRLVQRTVSRELMDLTRFSKQFETFMKRGKCLVVNRASQDLLFTA